MTIHMKCPVLFHMKNNNKKQLFKGQASIQMQIVNQPYMYMHYDQSFH